MLASTAAAVLAAAEAAPSAPSNPILPTLNEMFWAAVFFLALWALMKFVLLPPILRTMDGRAEKVREDQAAAEAAATAREQKLAEYEAELAGARAEALTLLEQARMEGDAERRSQLSAVETEVAAARAAAAAEVAEAKARARTELTGSITDIAVSAAEAVIQKSVDRSAHSRVVEDYVNRTGNEN